MERRRHGAKRLGPRATSFRPMPARSAHPLSISRRQSNARGHEIVVVCPVTKNLHIVHGDAFSPARRTLRSSPAAECHPLRRGSNRHFGRVRKHMPSTTALNQPILPLKRVSFAAVRNPSQTFASTSPARTLIAPAIQGLAWSSGVDARASLRPCRDTDCVASTHLSRPPTRRSKVRPQEPGNGARAPLQATAFRFIADQVAAGHLLARSDPVDEWLQVALALSIEIFLERPPDPAATHGRPAVSTDRSGDHEASPAVVHVPRIDGWMAIIRRIHAGCGDARRIGRARFPLTTQWTEPSGADDGVNGGSGCSCATFDPRRIPSLRRPFVPRCPSDQSVAVMERRSVESAWRTRSRLAKR